MGKQTNKATAAGLIIALGIIYGDIGTSPLYVLNEIIKGRVINEELILGSLSCIIWTLTLQTTVKYVILTLRADNKGEGGIFSLYALVRRRKKWLVIPAMLGGAALLADGIITPPITVTSAIEGLKQIKALENIQLSTIIG
ncbi:MAG: KUP/HAK/KT family potassium transporter, partial [Bacteroidota bacterium]